MNKEQKEFDRSMCFTFFKTYHEQIMDVKEEFGLEEAFKVYEAIVNYGLYQTEITERRLRILMGNATIEQIELSQQKRSRGFSGENFEQTKAVAEYMRDHPGASQRVISSATKASKTKVAKVQKNIRESGFDSIDDYLKYIVYPNIDNGNTSYNNNGNSNNNINNNSMTETETDQRDRSSWSQCIQTEGASPEEDFYYYATKEKNIKQSESELTKQELDAILERFETKGNHNVEKDFNVSEKLASELWDKYGFSPFN